MSMQTSSPYQEESPDYINPENVREISEPIETDFPEVKTCCRSSHARHAIEEIRYGYKPDLW